MKLSLGFSPCPNDTFIFEALVNKKIETDGIEFDVHLEDVETLNQWAQEDKLDVSKLSFPAYFQSLDNYILLSAGSALGKGVGPLLVSKNSMQPEAEGINPLTIALPGAYTTANLLFSFAFPDATNKKFILFSDIEEAVLNGEADLGVLIHENRFTYEQKGLYKVMDLGTNWESKKHQPIPLGGIAISQSVKRSTALKVDQLIRKSLEYAFANYPAIPDYVKQHAQAMDETVMRQHIDLYVNDFSLQLGENGRSAIETLYSVYTKMHETDTTQHDSLFL